VIPFVESLLKGTAKSNDWSKVEISELPEEPKPKEIYKFFRAILCFVEAKSHVLLEMGVPVHGLNKAKKMFIYQFIWKYLKGFDAKIAPGGMSFEAMFGTMDLPQLIKIDKMLVKCGVTRADRLEVLMKLPSKRPGKQNGVVGNFQKTWTEGKKKGVGWWATKDEYKNRPKNSSNKPISVPWVGHVYCLATLYPDEPNGSFNLENLGKVHTIANR